METLRPYQTDMVDAPMTAFFDQGLNRILLRGATGIGKSTVVSYFFRHERFTAWLEQFPEQDRKGLVIAHREELLDQMAERIRRNNPGLMVMVEQGDRRASVYADVIVASIQTLSAMDFKRLKRFLARMTFRLVVVDEAHHAAAATYRTALVHLGFLPPEDATSDRDMDGAKEKDVLVMQQALAGWDERAPKDRLLVGVTATPNRFDAVGLGCVFQTIAYSYGLREAIKDGWLVDIVPWAIETSTSLDAVKVQRGDFNQRELADTVNTPERNRVGLVAWEEYGKGRPTIGFTVDVAHAHAMAELFCTNGYRAAAVSGETPKDDRRIMLRQFSEGQLDQLFNCMVLTEGTDLPRTSCILHLKPTKSATLYEQMTGRGLRLFPGKNDCVVIDLVDVGRRHSLQAAPSLYGLHPGVLAQGRKLNAVADAVDDLLANAAPSFTLDEALKDGRHMTLEQLGALAKRINPWAVADLGDFGQGRFLRWVKTGGDSFRVQYPWADGMEVLEVSKDLVDRWEVSLTLRPANGPKRQRVLMRELPSSDAAAALAEAFVKQERESVTRLKAADAPWRSRPVSPRQLETLKRLGVPSVPPKCTMGQASDMIDLAMSRKRR